MKKTDLQIVSQTTKKTQLPLRDRTSAMRFTETDYYAQAQAEKLFNDNRHQLLARLDYDLSF